MSAVRGFEANDVPMLLACIDEIRPVPSVADASARRVLNPRAERLQRRKDCLQLEPGANPVVEKIEVHGGHPAVDWMVGAEAHRGPDTAPDAADEIFARSAELDSRAGRPELLLADYFAARAAAVARAVAFCAFAIELTLWK